VLLCACCYVCVLSLCVRVVVVYVLLLLLCACCCLRVVMCILAYGCARLRGANGVHAPIDAAAHPHSPPPVRTRGRTRYRQRYLDLIINNKVRDNFIIRSKAVKWVPSLHRLSSTADAFLTGVPAHAY